MKSKWSKKLILFLWYIISIVLLIIGVQAEIKYVFMLVLGEFISFIGILKCFKSFSGWLLLDVGLGFMLYPIFEIIGISYISVKVMKKILLIFGGMFIIQLFFDDTLRFRNEKKNCKMKYLAKCISFSQATKTAYVPIYKYNIDGKPNTFLGDGRITVNPKLGDIVPVFVNQRNNKEFYCPTSKSILMIRYMLGLLVGLFIVGILIVL